MVDKPVAAESVSPIAAIDQSERRHMVDLVLPEVMELIAAGNRNEMKAALDDWHVVDLAELLDALDEPDDRREFFRAWDGDDALELFEELEVPDRAGLLGTLGREERRWLLNAMSPDDRTDLFADGGL